MEKPNFIVKDIQKILHNYYKKFFWTGKIFDEQICDYKDLEIEDFNNQSMHSFLFIDRESCVCERDIQISNTNFKIYEDSEFPQVEKDLSTIWRNLLENKIVKNTENLWKN